MLTSKNFTTSGNSPAQKARQETADPERQSLELRGTHKPECAQRCHPACGLRPARDGENEALEMIISEACTVEAMTFFGLSPAGQMLGLMLLSPLQNPVHSDALLKQSVESSHGISRHLAPA